METGIPINTANIKTKRGRRGTRKKLDGQKGTLMSKIKKILALHTLADENWVKAVSAQYFLIGIAELLKFNTEQNQDYALVLDESFSSIKLNYKGGFKIDEKNILIIPDENDKLLACMQDEDTNDGYYLKTRLRAELIQNPELIYKNYHYGLMLKISGACNTPIFNTVQSLTLDELFRSSSLDPYGGWYHYRLPWITARILISLKNVNYSNRIDYYRIDKIINEALKSLIDRVCPDYYWRSGAGDWVSKWESTGLCLEALYVYEEIDNNKDIIDEIIGYLLSESTKQLWLNTPDFSTEQSTNETLASIILASVTYRLTHKYYKKIFNEIKSETEIYFLKCLEIIENRGENIVRQYCTIPEILYYIAITMKE